MQPPQGYGGGYGGPPPRTPLMQPEDADRLLKPLLIGDLRSLCRARGLNPAGGKDQLTQRLKDNMYMTNYYSLAPPPGGGGGMDGPPVAAPASYNQYTPGGQDAQFGTSNNNYQRPGGQNVGNFITDRPTSHVMAPPGGFSSIQLGGYDDPPPAAPSNAYGASASPSYPSTGNGYGSSSGADAQANNYTRPSGMQNVGNFLTDRPTSRVLAPPGGASSITFGDDSPANPANYQSSPPAPPAGSWNSPGQAAGYGGGSDGGGYGGGAGAYGQSAYGANPGAGYGASPGGGYGASPGGGYGASPGGGYGGGNAAGGYGGGGNPYGGQASYGGAAQPSSAYGGQGGYGGAPAYGGSSGGGAGGYGADDSYGAKTADVRGGYLANNYSRPGGQQNTGNFITDRPTSRVLAPPGGKSQVMLG